MKKAITVLLLFITLTTSAQNAAGYWYGTANVGTGDANNYLIELILNQTGSRVQGIVNYYFKNTFRSFKTSGYYYSTSRELQLQNIPVTFFGSNMRMEVDCNMDLKAQLRAAVAGSNLNGGFISKPAYKNTCPDIMFNLKLNKDAGNQDSILTALRLFKETYQVWTPSATDTLVAATVLQQPVVNYVVTGQYKEREKEITQEITVDSDSLLIDFYDNGEVDGDSISIFYNDKLLASSQKLSVKSIRLQINLDSTKEVNELTMFADNLGSIPPNTALMLLYDGKKRYEVRMSSTLSKSAAVRIRRKPPTK
jgi:hypothetical protein